MDPLTALEAGYDRLGLLASRIDPESLDAPTELPS